MTAAAFTKATITVGEGKPVQVHFNPASLRVTTTNQFKDDQPHKVSKPTSFKLDVELIFDSTQTVALATPAEDSTRAKPKKVAGSGSGASMAGGSDIYQATREIRDAASATGRGASGHSRAAGAPSPDLKIVTFTWGTTIYKGYIESLNETLDYWSSDGVPLRCTMQISIKGDIQNFLTGEYGQVRRQNDDLLAYPSVVRTTDDPDNEQKLMDIANAMGAASSARGVAALNGLESMRGGASAGASAGAFAGASASASAGASAGASASAGAGGLVTAGAGAQLQAAAGFQMPGGVSAGAAAGFGMGASAGLSAGAGLGASVGVGMAAGAGASLGGGLSAGAGAGFGASAGLGAGAGFGGSAGAGFGGMAGFSAGGGVGMGAGASGSGGGFSMTTSSNVTGFDGVTRSSTTTTTGGFGGDTRTTTTSSQTSGGWGSASAGIPASAGAFAGLGMSQATLPGAGFNPDVLLPPPGVPVTTTTLFDASGRAMSANGQVAASYSARSSVTVW